MNLEDTVNIARSLAGHPDWIAEKFTRGMALVDLILLANNKDNQARLNGQLVNVPKGCLAWSVRGLAQRWKWDKGRVERYLRRLADEGTILRREDDLLQLRNYVEWNPTETPNETGPRQDQDTPVTGVGRRGEEEGGDTPLVASAPVGQSWRRETGSDSDPAAETGAPTRGQIMEFAATFPGEPATGTPGPIPAATACRFHDFYRSPGRTFPTRWQAMLTRWWAEDFAADKKTAPPAQIPADIIRLMDDVESDGELEPAHYDMTVAELTAECEKLDLKKTAHRELRDNLHRLIKRRKREAVEREEVAA